MQGVRGKNIDQGLSTVITRDPSPHHDHPVNTVTLLLRPRYSGLKELKKKTLGQSFSYLQDPFNMATSLMLLDFCDLLVIGLTGFLCILMRLKKVLAQLISTQKTMPNLARVRKNTFRCKPVPLKKIKHVSSRTTHGPGGPRVQEGYANDRNVGWKSETTVRLPHELEACLRFKFACFFEYSGELRSSVSFWREAIPLYNQNK